MRSTLLSLALCAVVVALPAARQEPEVLAFVGASVFTRVDRAPLGKAVLLVRDGRVAAVGPAGDVTIPSGARRVDVSGRAILPGLVNAHGHVGETRGLATGPEQYSRENVVEQLRLYARYGVTTVYSLGGDQASGAALRDEQERSGMDRARLFIAGPVVTARTVEEVPAQVGQVSAMRADFVKFRVDDNLGTTEKMRPEVYRAVIADAQRRGLPTAVHIYYLDDAKDVLRAGADLIAHSIRDREVDDEFVTLAKTRGACVCPTLTREVSTYVYESEPEFLSDPFFRRYADSSVLDQLREPDRQKAVAQSRSAQQYKAGLDVAMRNLKTLQDKGVPIAFGTDSGPPGRFQGYFEHMEMDLMAKAGLSAKQILEAATTGAARCMKAPGGLGTLEVGAWADLIVLGESPLSDIRKMRSIESVWIGGREVARW